MLHGVLADRGIVTLLDVQWAGMNVGKTSTFQFEVGAVLVGVLLDKPETPFARHVNVVWPALARLLPPWPVQMNPTPKAASKYVRFEVNAHSVRWNDGAVEAIWRYEWHLSAGQQHAELDMEPVVILTSATPRSYRWWADEWLVPLNEFLTIMGGSRARPASVTLWPKRRPSRADRGSTRLTLHARGIGAHDYDATRRHEAFLTAADINLNPGGLHEVMGRFKTLAQRQSVFLDLLVDAIGNPDRPLRNRYLDAVSALEAYDTQSRGVGPLDPAKFSSQRTSVVAAAMPNLPPVNLKFLKRWLARRSFYSLPERLGHLAKSVGVAPTLTVSASRLAELRNDVAHGNAGVDLSELSEAFDQAVRVGRRIVCAELGIV
jgi:hypothetical protein